MYYNTSQFTGNHSQLLSATMIRGGVWSRNGYQDAAGFLKEAVASLTAVT